MAEPRGHSLPAIPDHTWAALQPRGKYQTSKPSTCDMGIQALLFLKAAKHNSWTSSHPLRASATQAKPCKDRLTIWIPGPTALPHSQEAAATEGPLAVCH